ncbi:MAG: hypothetical protein RLZZ15_1758 [Verrucomicrobiota bacterium]|jgi:peroxiredoxin
MVLCPSFPFLRRHFLVRLAVLAGVVLGGAAATRAAEPPQVGGVAPDFSLAAIDGAPVRLAELTTRGPVVLIVLRGWPGYQCPLCDRQVNEFVAARAAFASAPAQVVFVYPGPAADLRAHAAEFQSIKGREWPAAFRFALDPDFTMVNAYALRWAARGETAYPSTFVLDRGGVVRFAKISRTHGDRAKAADILAALEALRAP